MALDELIKKQDVAVYSSNPLRFREPGISFGAQSNTWGKEGSAQKQLLLAAVCVDDIEHLIGIMNSLPLQEINEYTKKLLGRYIILEMNSLYLCFRNLKQFDDKIPRQVFDDLDSKIHELENNHGFQAIRNEIAAHKDSNLDVLEDLEFQKKVTWKAIQRYFDTFQGFIQKIKQYYPDEVTLYFQVRNQPMHDVPPSGPMGGYTLFD